MMLHIILPHLKGAYLQCCKSLGKKTEIQKLDSKNETQTRPPGIYNLFTKVIDNNKYEAI